MAQADFFNLISPNKPSNGTGSFSLDKFQGSVMFAAVGDALGWPTEFLKPDSRRTPSFSLPVRDFVHWHKLVGGKWWGYDEQILPGQYSDDTQLMLAVARSISDTGSFEPEQFAYQELPLWLQYERGGGRSIKTAARKLIGKKANWSSNFYEQGDVLYVNAGANGAAMRNLPIALVNAGDESRLIRDSFLNAIVTHGHPRALIGAILYALAVRYVINAKSIEVDTFIDYLQTMLQSIGKTVANDDTILKWIKQWDTPKSSKKPDSPLSFRQVFDQSRKETENYLSSIARFLQSDPREYYSFVGALQPETKGSGLSTVCAALYIFLAYTEKPTEALITAANMLGSDTDTIGVFLGSLLGAFHGMEIIPKPLLEKLQDNPYLLKVATRLHRIAQGEETLKISDKKVLSRQEAYLRILAWEIGLNEMFWDALNVGGVVFHPTIGRGTIINKVEKPIHREDYVTKLIEISFDCGQSCIFHSRVQKESGKVFESLAEDVGKALV